jgi:hypothetical protein
MPLFSENARHGPGGEGLLEKPGPAGEDPGGRAARRPLCPGLGLRRWRTIARAEVPWRMRSVLFTGWRWR